MHLHYGNLSVDAVQLLYHSSRSCVHEVTGVARSGGSTGTAFVWFHHPEAAQDAFQKYNNIALDGKPMRIQFDHSEKILTSGVRYVYL